MIIDAHSHLGQCSVFDADQSADDLLAAMDSAAVATSIVQPFPGSADPRADHDAIAKMASQNAGRVRGLVSMNPHSPEHAYINEVRRCVKDFSFVGVKIHTIGHAVAPGSRVARLVFRTAADLGVAVMIHTGPGIPFAEPASWVPMALEFSDIPVVLAHAGASMFTPAAIVAAEQCPNVVLETSSCAPQDIKQAVTALGEEKVMFGSDMLFNIESEVAKYAAVDLFPDACPEVFANTAKRVFRLNEDN